MRRRVVLAGLLGATACAPSAPSATSAPAPGVSSPGSGQQRTGGTTPLGSADPGSASARGADPAGASPSSAASSSAASSSATPGSVAPGSAPASTSASPSPRPSSAPPSLVGDTRNAWAFAPLADPSRVVVEGSVPQQRAWSTSKVLVVLAMLQTAAGGDPGRLSSQQREQVRLALTASDADALIALRSAIQGGRGASLTAVLRACGDTTTTAPDSLEGTMSWSVREQVRLMAALAAGSLVSPAASAYVLSQLMPIASQRWGLPSAGASATKGGWLRASTETRQMGILGDHAVAIITAGVGPALTQSDGDAAHVAQMDTLAAMLRTRLAAS